MIRLTEQGLYCEEGGFHIDPTKRVDLAVTTHAHSDHARRGSREYICAKPSVRLLAHRMGKSARIRGVPYRERFKLGKAWVSFHPAGHILGSAQVRIEVGSRVWVASGDYKRDIDPSCDPFEVVPCDTFISEATFGHPSYKWGDPAETVREIFAWWEGNRARGKNSLLYCYSLGKTQRVLAGLLAHTDRAVYTYGESTALSECYRAEGVALAPFLDLETHSSDRRLAGELIIAPHSIGKTDWEKNLGYPETAFASGWMRTGAFGVASRYDRGFALSDHADWDALVRTAQETGARRVLLMYEGAKGGLAAHLKSLGIEASALSERSLARASLPEQGDLFGSLMPGA